MLYIECIVLCGCVVVLDVTRKRARILILAENERKVFASSSLYGAVKIENLNRSILSESRLSSIEGALSIPELNGPSGT